MMNIEILEIVQKSIPNFNPDDEKDIVKAQKLLKVENKLNHYVENNEIEKFTTFFHQYGSRFMFLFKDKNVRAILKNDIDTFTGFPSDFIHNQNIEITKHFAELFANEVYHFILKCLKTNVYYKLIDLFEFYEFLIAPTTLEKSKQQISNRNKNLLEIINDTSKYQFFDSHLNYALNPSYYRLQSEIDSYYFENQVLQIGILARTKKTNKIKNKYCLGKILVATSSFNSSSVTTNYRLHENLKSGNIMIKMYEERRLSSYILPVFFGLLIISTVLIRVLGYKLNKNSSNFFILLLLALASTYGYIKQKSKIHK